METARPAITPPAPLAALCGWLVPGAGYWLLGERVRAAIVGIAVVLVFAAGVLVGGIRVVDAPSSLGVGAVLEKPWFIGQVLTGPVSVAAALWANQVAQNDPDRISHSRSWEIGTLYTAVAGMLNLLAIIDATHRAASGNPDTSGTEGAAGPDGAGNSGGVS
jgi:hypothetical protein